ncbi:metallophosphoesterase [Paraburkholderia dipogonis]|uniref:metallophosphoesterase n=1 Tax=Paraburkholderia dipogonis TaxID=1211383 RepID=UPI0035E65D7C
MKLQIASDLHIERLRIKARFGGLTPAAKADALVLAGDIHRGETAVTMFADWPVPVIYVLGNHEYYGSRIGDLEIRVKQLAQGTMVQVLVCDELQLNGIRFLGCTLWSDFRLNRAHRKSMAQAASSPDFARILNRSGRPLSPEDVVSEHRMATSWLHAQLTRPFRGPTVVVTHHAPHCRSLNERFRRTLAAASFASDLTHIIPGADLWIHGHVHSSSDYREHGRKIICNPRGRPLPGVDGCSVAGTNRQFSPDLIYEVR